MGICAGNNRTLWEMVHVYGGAQPRAPCVDTFLRVYWPRQQGAEPERSKLEVGACRHVAVSLAAGTDSGGGLVRGRQAHFQVAVDCEFVQQPHLPT